MTDWRERPVGFFPFFANLAETSRLVRTAERFRELGGQAVFFSHGGDYEELARESDPMDSCRSRLVHSIASSILFICSIYSFGHSSCRTRSLEPTHGLQEDGGQSCR